MKNARRGATLIEALLYFGLFAMLVGGGLAAAYGVIVTAGRASERATVAAEGDFLSAKIGWLLSDLDEAGIASPADGSTGTLEVLKSGVTIRLGSRDADATLTRGDAAPETLNGGGVRVARLRFERGAGRDGLDAVTASFTLSASAAGPLISQDFSYTSYLLP